MSHFSPEDRAKGHAAHRERRDREFWSRVRVDGECLIWIGARQTRTDGYEGYGVLWRHKRLVYAHRFAFAEFYRTEIPPGIEVMHTCDRPPCIRPSHLRLGTHAENMKDMMAKGRHGHGPGRPDVLARNRVERPELSRRAGTRVAKLSVAQVASVKRRLANGETHASIATRFGVGRVTISDIKAGRAWVYVEAEPENEGDEG